MRKIGMSLAAMILQSEQDTLAVVDKMAEVGFTATFTAMLEMDKQLALAELLAKKGIQYESLHAPSPHINDMWLPGEDGDHKLAQLCQCTDHAHAAGADIVVVHLSSGEDAPPVTDIGRERFTKLVEHADRQGVRIAFENQRKVSNLAWAFETFPKDSNVGFCWDNGHEMVFAHGRQYMPLFGDRLIFTHIHDNYAVFQQDKHLLPFDGTFDWHRFARQLNESGYQGSLMLEVDYRKSPELYGNLTYLEYVERAAAAIKRLRRLTDGAAE